MKNRNKGIKSSEIKSAIRGLSNNEITNQKAKELFTVNFKDLDVNQGQTFLEWEKEGLLAPMLDRIKEYCKMPLSKNLGDRFKSYGSFPPKSNFKHPKHVPNDVNWASLHIKGRVCIAGYIYENIFYVVFLDKNHEFWICEKKHT